jgi:hypothetical protein
MLLAFGQITTLESVLPEGIGIYKLYVSGAPSTEVKLYMKDFPFTASESPDTLLQSKLGWSKLTFSSLRSKFAS